MSVLKVAFGLPAYGGKVSAEHTRMFLELGHTLAISHERFQLAGWFMIDNCGIEKARNELLRMAREAEADWLLMIDADTWVVHNDVDDAGVQLLRMISQADKADATIVGAPVMRRHAQAPAYAEVMVYDIALDQGQQGCTTLLARSPHRMGQELGPCDALATACFAVNVQKTKDCTFKFTDALSEDLEFCRQVRESRAFPDMPPPILVDGRVRTAHLSRPYPIYYGGGGE